MTSPWLCTFGLFGIYLYLHAQVLPRGQAHLVDEQLGGLKGAFMISDLFIFHNTSQVLKEHEMLKPFQDF